MKSVSSKKPPAQKKTQLDSSSRFNTIPACDGRIDERIDVLKDRRTHYDDTCIYRASI